MAWNQVNTVEQRLNFVSSVAEDRQPMAVLCRQFGISRKTGYKWLQRYRNEGLEGLYDLPRAPRTHGRAIEQVIVDLIIAERKTYPLWGPKKIKARLERFHPELDLPSASTIGNILTREGLVVPRGRSRKAPPKTQPLAHATDCNVVWCMDFKGWFLVGNGDKCEPFTVTDGHSRYLIHCLPLPRGNFDEVWPNLSSAFRTYGRPLRIRSDNGSPFATRNVGRLSRLGVHLIKWRPPERRRLDNRTTVERCFARLKDDFGGRNFRVRGAQKVYCHLMFGVIALMADQPIRLLQ